MRRWLLSTGALSRLAGIAGLIGLAVVLGTAAPASAHNQLTSSDPEDGARLEQGPQQVRLTFLASPDPDGAELAVTGPDGDSAVTGEPEFDGTDVTVPVRAPAAGEYEVTYRVPSTDGHWAEGSIGFMVTVGTQPSPFPSPDPSPSPVASSPAEEPAGDQAEGPAAEVAPRAGAGDGGFLLPWWGWLLLVVVVGGAAGAFAWRRSARRRPVV